MILQRLAKNQHSWFMTFKVIHIFLLFNFAWKFRTRAATEMKTISMTSKYSNLVDFWVLFQSLRKKTLHWESIVWKLFRFSQNSIWSKMTNIYKFLRKMTKVFFSQFQQTLWLNFSKQKLRSKKCHSVKVHL